MLYTVNHVLVLQAFKRVCIQYDGLRYMSFSSLSGLGLGFVPGQERSHGQEAKGDDPESELFCGLWAREEMRVR